jgi:S-adenosylmethionine:tRNA ribosyltransferase-isomerase
VRTSDFSYRLPPELIAQRPIRPRDSSRLLVFNRKTNETRHQEFHEIIEFLSPKDVLVLNETKVIPARLNATKIPSGGAVEILLLERSHERTWDVIVGGRGVGVGMRLKIRGGPEALVIKDSGKAKRQIKFSEPISKNLEKIGEMPTPPYIHAPIESVDEYQTIYACEPGSAAAPTAGLHFTNRLFDQIQGLGTQIAKVTLHVGLDTFAPVNEEAPTDHQIHQEWCRVSEETARTINEASSAGGRIIAVGTTSVRTLETASGGTSSGQTILPFEGYTSLYILPGYSFKVVDSIITNFHLPQSTLIMMISAFTGRKTLMKLYKQAISLKYRFYSFGDAMFIL